MRHAIVGAAQLEGEDDLLVLTLEQHAASEALRKNRREIERRLDRNVVDFRGEDFLEVIDGHFSALRNQTIEGSRNGDAPDKTRSDAQ
jgi:hypothetical protein